MPRPPKAPEGAQFKEFIVNDGYIMADNNNVRKEGGDTIALTYEQAQHFIKQGVVSVPLEEFGNEPNATEDTVEEATGNKTEGGREPPVGDPFATALKKAD